MSKQTPHEGQEEEGLSVRPFGKNSYRHLGASIYDVCTEGGGGVSLKEDVVREVA